MASDWIPKRKGLSRTREVIGIAARTKRTRQEVVGWLCEFWDLADDESTDGKLPGVSLEMLVSTIGPDIEFYLAMVNAGWLIQAGDGLIVPNFAHWLGRSAKNRLQNTIRKRWSRLGRAETETTGQDNTGQDNTEKNLGGEDAGNPSDSRSDLGPKRTPRKRDELFDAVAEVTASDPKASGSYLGRVCKALRSADPPYTAAEVLRLAEIAPVELPWLKGRLTLGLVEQFIGRVRAAPSAPKVKKSAFEEALRKHRGEE